MRRNILPWHSKKIVHLLFCVFQTKLNKAVNFFCRLPEWIRNAQMILGFSAIKTWMRILHGQLKRLKIRKAIEGTYSPHTDSNCGLPEL